MSEIKTTGAVKAAPDKAKYGPTDKAKANPTRTRVNKKSDWIGLGGSITLKAVPPKRPKDIVIREANDKEYEHFKFLKHLVKKL
jgi:hypothetical protein